MGRKFSLSLAIPMVITLAACNHNAALRQEIGQIENRLTSIEAEIAQGTSQIGSQGKDIRTRIAYRPLEQWAADFGSKTMTFRQKDRAGNLADQDHKCYFDSGRLSWIKRDGYRAWIHEDKSTKIDFTVGPFTFIPTDQGFQISSDIDLKTKTQIGGAFRPRCLGWLPSVNLGVEGRSRPTTILELQLSQPSNLQPQYKLALVSPKQLDVELRTGFKFPGGYDFDIKTTARMDNFARHLANGEFNLLVKNSSEVVMPDGSVRLYRLSTVDPTVQKDRTGIMLETDVELRRETQ